MSKTRVWIAVVACFVLCFASLLYAESAPSTSNTAAMVDVLKTLESKGVITHQEFETLSQKVTTEAEAPQLRTVAMQESEGKAMNVVSAMDSGVGFHAGRFDIAFSGEVNGFYVHDRPDTSNGIGFLFNCDLCQVSSQGRSNSSIRSGLLPSDLSIKISTQEHGWDVAVFFGLWPSINNNGGGAGQMGAVEGSFGATTAVSTPGIDMRQNFVTLGRPGFGTLKVGRDLGLFGQEAILNDMTLLGAGTPFGNTFPGNVTLGRIGVGYIYTDFIPQITYTSPSVAGLQAAVGIFTPYQDPIWGLALAGNANGSLTGHGQPMIQGKLTYTVPTHGPVKAKVWSNVITQSMEVQNGDPGGGTLPPGDSIRATGVDYGAKLDFHGLSLVGYGYNTWGVGILGIFWDGLGVNSTNTRPEVRPSQGWYGQLTYTAHRNTFGFSYGQSNLSPANSFDQFFMQTGGYIGVPTIRNNTSYVAQYRLAVTKWDNLVAEYTHTTSENQNFVKGGSDSIALGTIVFF